MGDQLEPRCVLLATAIARVVFAGERDGLPAGEWCLMVQCVLSLEMMKIEVLLRVEKPVAGSAVVMHFPFVFQGVFCVDENRSTFGAPLCEG